MKFVRYLPLQLFSIFPKFLNNFPPKKGKPNAGSEAGINRTRLSLLDCLTVLKYGKCRWGKHMKTETWSRSIQSILSIVFIKAMHMHMQKLKSKISCFPWLSQPMIKDRVKIFFFICYQITGAWISIIKILNNAKCIALRF